MIWCLEKKRRRGGKWKRGYTSEKNIKKREKREAHGVSADDVKDSAGKKNLIDYLNRMRITRPLKEKGRGERTQLCSSLGSDWEKEGGASARKECDV